MNKKSILYWIIMSIALITSSYLIYRQWLAPKKIPLYQTGRATKRTIIQSIKATGYLNVIDLMKIGSVVPGVIRKINVAENDTVKKGQLIAEIDDGKEDTDVCRTKAEWERAQAILAYQEQFFNRQEQLYECNHISKDAYQQAIQNLKIAKADVDSRKASYDQAKLIYDNKFIKSPDDGIVIEKVSTEGETVTLASPATIIYTIAKNITQMEAKIEIDESSVAHIHKGMEAQLSYDAYPHRIFKGTISDISNAPINLKGAVSYYATINIDNSQNLFRPGMSVDAKIIITNKPDVLSVPNNLFKFNHKIIEAIAKTEGKSVKALDKKECDELAQKGSFKTLWIDTGRSFVETPVQIGANDNAFFEIISGLSESDNIIIDTIEPDAMKKMFDKFFGKGLSE